MVVCDIWLIVQNLRSSCMMLVVKILYYLIDWFKVQFFMIVLCPGPSAHFLLGPGQRPGVESENAVCLFFVVGFFVLPMLHLGR